MVDCYMYIHDANFTIDSFQNAFSKQPLFARYAYYISQERDIWFRGAHGVTKHWVRTSELLREKVRRGWAEFTSDNDRQLATRFLLSHFKRVGCCF